jgi:serine/threonine-protein kinase
VIAGAAPVAADLTPRLAGYRVKGELNSSGMTLVYLAEDVRLARRVAVKVLRRPIAFDERHRRRFLRECLIAANLDHPRIVPVYAAGETEELVGAPYYVMPYLPGGDLQNMLDVHGPLSLDLTVTVVAQLAEALDYVHARGLVHRDVKPKNVLVDTTTGTRCYLSDFGIATGVDERPHTGPFAGSLGFSPPEQVGGQVVDRRADVHALGCLLYVCLTGVEPHGPRRSVLALRPDLPTGLDLMIRKAMAPRPADRHHTCGRLADALREIGARYG